jgi:hypothetical protein
MQKEKRESIVVYKIKLDLSKYKCTVFCALTFTYIFLLVANRCKEILSRTRYLMFSHQV